MKKIVNFNLIEKMVSEGYIADYVMNSGKTYELYFNTEKEFDGIIVDNLNEEEIEKVTEYFFSPDFTDTTLEEYDIVEEIKNKKEMGTMKKRHHFKVEILTTGEVIPYDFSKKEVDFEQETVIDITIELKLVNEFMHELFWCGNVPEQQLFQTVKNQINRKSLEVLIEWFEDAGLTVEESAVLLQSTPCIESNFENLLEFYQSNKDTVYFKPNFEETYINALLDVD